MQFESKSDKASNKNGGGTQRPTVGRKAPKSQHSSLSKKSNKDKNAGAKENSKMKAQPAGHQRKSKHDDDLDDKYINSLEEKPEVKTLARKKRQVKSAGKAKANQTKMKQKQVIPDPLYGALQSSNTSRGTKKSKSVGVSGSNLSSSRWTSNRAQKRVSLIDGLNACIFQQENQQKKSAKRLIKQEIKEEDANNSAEESKAQYGQSDCQLKNFISAFEVLKFVEDESILECDTVDYNDKDILQVACNLNAPTQAHSTQRKIRDMIINGMNKKYAHVTPNICRKVIEFNSEVEAFNDSVSMVIEQCQLKAKSKDYRSLFLNSSTNRSFSHSYGSQKANK